MLKSQMTGVSLSLLQREHKADRVDDGRWKLWWNGFAHEHGEFIAVATHDGGSIANYVGWQVHVNPEGCPDTMRKKEGVMLTIYDMKCITICSSIR
jgi:hypothetical protein